MFSWLRRADCDAVVGDIGAAWTRASDELLLRERLMPPAELPGVEVTEFDTAVTSVDSFKSVVRPFVRPFLLFAFFSSSLMRNLRSSSSSSSIISSMLTSLRTFRLMLTTLLFEVCLTLPVPMLDMSEESGDEAVLTLTPSFFKIVFTELMLTPPDGVAGLLVSVGSLVLAVGVCGGVEMALSFWRMVVEIESFIVDVESGFEWESRVVRLLGVSVVPMLKESVGS